MLLLGTFALYYIAPLFAPQVPQNTEYSILYNVWLYILCLFVVFLHYYVIMLLCYMLCCKYTNSTFGVWGNAISVPFLCVCACACACVCKCMHIQVHLNK